MYSMGGRKGGYSSTELDHRGPAQSHILPHPNYTCPPTPFKQFLDARAPQRRTVSTRRLQLSLTSSALLVLLDFVLTVRRQFEAGKILGIPSLAARKSIRSSAAQSTQNRKCFRGVAYKEMRYVWRGNLGVSIEGSSRVIHAD